MTSLTSPFQVGDRLALRGAEWTVVETTAWPDCVLVRVTPQRPHDGPARTFVYPADRPRAIRDVRRLAVVRPRRWLHSVRRAAGGLAPYGGLVAAPRHAIDLLPHQLEPALALLRHGATRILIADGVGLGKTIQAGLVLAELHARRMEFRALVLAPAGLRNQWCDELASRFHLEPVFADSDWLRTSVRDRPAGVNPWSVPGIYVASFDFVKRPEVLRPLEDTTWDLVVIDEAHAAAAGTDRRAAAHAIAQRAARVLLLTATPHAGDAAGFHALCGLGAIGRSEPPVVLFRRSHEALGHSRLRRSLLLPVRLTEAELRMHAQLEMYTRRVWRESSERNDQKGRLASIVLRKRALSSAASLTASIERRLSLLAGAAPAPGQPRLPLDDEEPLDDGGLDVVLGAPGLADTDLERQWLENIAVTARQAACDESKLRRLTRLLSRTRESAIVFTEYRDTLIRIAAVLARAGREPLVMHGGLSPAERVRVQQDFNTRGTTLLATDAASEGLNLHARCRFVIHFELPWSAARLAQRAGRVDRLGQTRRVHEVALLAASTAERLVVGPLMRRAARARTSGAAAPRVMDVLTESRVGEIVLGGRSAAVLSGSRERSEGNDVRVLHLTDDARVEVRRCADARGWLSRSGGGRGGPLVTYVSTLPRGQRAIAPGMILVHIVSVLDARGEVVHSEPFVLRASGPGGLLKTPATVRRWVQHALAGHSAAPALRGAELRILRDVLHLHTAAVRQVRRRLEARRTLIPSTASELVQASLFDRGALREAAARSRARSEQAEAFDHAVSLASPELRCQSVLAAVLVVTRARRP